MPVIFKKNKSPKGPGDKAPLGVILDFAALKPGLEPVDLTEDGIAEEFARQYRDQFRFDHEIGHWFTWTGSVWKLNRTELAFDYARLLCRKHRGNQTRMATKKAAEGVETMARRDQRLAVTTDLWDRNPFLLGTPGGTVDLKTGQLFEARRNDLITKQAAVTPAGSGAACPVFKNFLEEATAGDAGLQRFLQQYAGYALTGDTREQALIFIYGPGGNGKGVFLKAISEILGDYAKTAAMETFVSLRTPRHLTELAMLHGARLVTASETEQNHAWSEGRINQMTGEDPVTANFMRRDHFTFVPRFKLMLIGNHRPKLASVNEAARRRFNIVPFLHKPAKPDNTLAAKLRDEYSAILRWMIEGGLDWQKNGLVRPDVVVQATADYFTEQDLLGRWISERCDCGVGKQEKAANLYADWKGFALASGEEPGSATSFGSRLRERNFDSHKSGVTVYTGIRLKPHEQVVAS
jgi:putative DNA primase/helicase